MGDPPRRGEARPDSGQRLMVTFYVVRHGETQANRDGVIQGQTDIPLSKRGRLQAGKAALALSGIRLDAAYSSDLSRAAETARAIMQHQDCDLVFDRRLREIHGGEFQGLTRDEIAARYPLFHESFRRDPMNTRRPGGESFADLRDRVAQAIQDIYRRHSAKPGGAMVAVIGHGGVIRAILDVAGVDAELMEHVVGNCTITVLRKNEDGWAAVKIGDDAHLAGACLKGVGAPSGK